MPSAQSQIARIGGRAGIDATDNDSVAPNDPPLGVTPIPVATPGGGRRPRVAGSNPAGIAGF